MPTRPIRQPGPITYGWNQNAMQPAEDSDIPTTAGRTPEPRVSLHTKPEFRDRRGPPVAGTSRFSAGSLRPDQGPCPLPCPGGNCPPAAARVGADCSRRVHRDGPVLGVHRDGSLPSA